jgi:hypothetical protein
MSDTERGLYNKFNVTRTDGTSEIGQKHSNCRYFVLDLSHDPHAIKALHAYATSCAKTHPQLSQDLFKMLDGV